jgi:hypothetical protein
VIHFLESTESTVKKRRHPESRRCAELVPTPKPGGDRRIYTVGGDTAGRVASAATGPSAATMLRCTLKETSSGGAQDDIHWGSILGNPE